MLGASILLLQCKPKRTNVHSRQNVKLIQTHKICDSTIFIDSPPMEQLYPWLTTVLTVAPAVIAAASAIAALTPTPADDVWVAKLYKVVDWLALNVGKAKEIGTVPAATQKTGDKQE